MAGASIGANEVAFATKSRGNRIFYRVYVPGQGTDDEIKATVFIAHGLGEHSGRYINVVETLVPLGYKVVVPDHQGHGNSSGTRGHVMSWDEYLEDFREVIDRSGRKGARTIVLGHSMGGLIATRFVQAHPDYADALVTSGGFFKLSIEVPKIKAAIGKFMSKHVPWLTMSNDIDPNLLSHDKEVVQAYVNDNLVHRKVSARWFTEALKELETVHAEAPNITMPTLLMHGGADQLTGPEGSQEIFDKIKSGKKEIKIYDGFYHEIFNELERSKPLNDMKDWLEEL